MEKFNVIIEGSARHIHVTKEDLAKLFGEGYQLTPKKDLSQPGQFACNERVTLVGPKKEIAGVSILGPERSATQVEISLSDARTLGVKAPIRESGDVKGSAGIKVVGPAGEIELTEGVIAAKRHMHLTPEDAEKYGLADKEIVQIKVDGERALIFDEVVVRVSPKFTTRVHLDTDEVNAAGLAGDVLGEVIKK